MAQAPWKDKVDLFRRRFGAREDIFGVKYYAERTEVDKETGMPTTREESWFAPQCDNYGDQSLCLIAKRQGRCTTCTNKKYSRLTDEWIWKHISGQKELILYLLQDGGIKFGACDFDRGDPFEDAMYVRNFSVNALKLPCYVSRSSKKGYHVYWFFSEVVPAHLFTSMVRYIFSEVGIYARSQVNSEIPIPEVFPKQTVYDSAKMGNGIKIPMIEPRMKDGFNCWVDNEAKPYPINQQWQIFRNCEEVTPKRLDEVLQQHNIPVLRQPTSRSVRKTVTGPNGEVIEAPEHKIRKRGDFNQVVSHCPALRQFWEKDEDGSFKFEKLANQNGVPHNARLASMILAMSTTNGVDVIKERWNTEKTAYYVKHAEESGGYTPVTCRWLQERGLCKIGTHPIHGDHCFKKKPPHEVDGGRVVENPNKLPESEWPDPSPIRFATLREHLTVDQIEKHLRDLFAQEPQPVDREAQFHDLMRSAKRLSKDQYELITDLVGREKWVGTRDLKKADKEAQKDIKAEQMTIRKEAAGRSFEWNKDVYFIENGGYVRQWKDAKGVPHSDTLSNFTVDINEEVFEYERVEARGTTKGEYTRKNVIFIGSVNVIGEQPRGLRLVGHEWQKGTETFFSELIKVAGSSLLYERGNCDRIRICVNQLSKDAKKVRKRTADIGHMTILDRDCYMMPSVIVTKDSVEPNEEFEITFDDDACKALDFKILADDEFKDLARHIINDYFNCNVSIAAMTSFAHAMASTMLPMSPLSKSPLLFLYGNMGSGKSFVAEVAQCFFGAFKNFANTNSSGGGKLQLASQFKDALLLIDDFKKALADYGGKDMMKFIQMVYDRSGRHVLKRNGALRDNVARARGLLLVTGQDVPEQEDSVISRMLLVQVPSRKMDRARGDRVKDRMKDYCGFTPYFIQHVFNVGKEHIKSVYVKYVQLYSAPMRDMPVEVDGIHRISENLAMNMTAFHLAMEMLHVRGVIDQGRQEELCAQHQKNLQIVRVEIYNFVSSQKGVTVFLDTIRDLIQDPARAHVVDWPGHPYLEHKNSKPLGFFKESDPEHVYLYTGASYSSARDEVRKRGGDLHPQITIGKQLQGENHLKDQFWDRSDVACAKSVTGPHKGTVRCWVIKLSSLGVEPPQLPQQKPLTLVGS